MIIILIALAKSEGNGASSWVDAKVSWAQHSMLTCMALCWYGCKLVLAVPKWYRPLTEYSNHLINSRWCFELPNLHVRESWKGTKLVGSKPYHGVCLVH